MPSASEALGQLPRWDLSDLYDSMDSAALTADFERLSADTDAFVAAYQGKLEGLSGRDFGKAIQTYEAMEEIGRRIGSYAGLLHAGNMSDASIGRFYQTCIEKLTDINTRLLFFGLEINRLSDDTLTQLLEDPVAARYRPWLDEVRAFRPHQLSDEAEKLLSEKSVAGRSAWVRLFDETIAGLRFHVQGAELTEPETLHLLSESDGVVRKAAGLELSRVFGERLPLFALITNTLAKDKEIEDRWRSFKTPAHSRHLANQVEGEVVEALVSAVRASYPRLSHRYYQMKANWLGMDQLAFYDRNAPLPDVPERTIPWREARDTVLTAYNRFSPDLAAIGQRFFDNSWIDAPVRPGKDGGAFAHPTVPSAHPYLLLNYQGRTRDVMTLAHELGHGCHQILAGDQGLLLSDTPLTLAETASVFGEMLTFRSLLASESDPARRRALLAGKVEDMLNTVVRQIAFHTFEEKVHDARRSGELMPDELCDIWMQVQADSLGPGIRLDPEYRPFWCYIPHFLHSPFYVYAYAFGDCLVNALYGVYEQAEDGFAARYLELLRAGGSKRHNALLAPFGLDARDPGFWARGLGVIENFVDELQGL